MPSEPTPAAKRFQSMMKINVLAAGAALVITLLASPPALADIGITINGNPVNVYPAPIMQNGRVFVPMRSVFENLGASVVYSNGQIDATNGSAAISLTIGSTQATVNGSPVTIDVAPFVVGERTYVPLRFISQALGASVYWDDQDQIVQIATSEQGGESQGGEDQADTPPPPIPVYNPPPVPAPSYIWVPGYWGWGMYGYYWVPGTWVQAPAVGLLWTPGYWGWNNGFYAWHPGYWGPQIGFYGGINYGGGYYGNGYGGGMWRNNVFYYNAAVTTVTNTTIIKNVYVDRTVVLNNANVTHVSYNGGPGGTQGRPTPHDMAAARLSHVAMTPTQKQHAQVAAQDRALLAKVNGGKPPVLVTTHPFTPQSKPQGFTPVGPSDRTVVHTHPMIPAPKPAAQTPRPVVIPHAVVTRRPAPPQTPRPAAMPHPTPRAMPHPMVHPTAHPAATEHPHPPVRPRPTATPKNSKAM
jgi:hypothetical protein